MNTARLSDDGSWLALVFGTEVQLWHLPTGEFDGTLPDEGSTRHSSVFKLVKDAMQAAGVDGAAQALSMQGCHLVVTHDVGGEITGVAWSRDGRRVAFLLPFDCRVVVFDLEDGVLLGEISSVSYTHLTLPTTPYV